MLALVSSGSQYYNLLEYLHYKGIRRSEVKVLYFYHPPEFNSVFNFIYHDDFKKFSKIKNNIKTNILSKVIFYIQVWIHLFAYVLTINKYLISGQIWCNHHFTFSLFTRNECIVSLDDGNSNMFAFEAYKFRIFDQKKNKITHFTSCDLPYKYVIKNKNNLIHKNLNDIHFNKDNVMIIGSPFVYDKFIKFDCYLQLLRKLLHKYSDKNVYYIPHRREVLSDLNNLFASEFIIESKGCFELWLIQQTEIPSHFINFGSGLAITINELFGATISQSFVSVKSILFNQQTELYKDYDEIIELYSQFCSVES